MWQVYEAEIQNTINWHKCGTTMWDLSKNVFPSDFHSFQKKNAERHPQTTVIEFSKLRSYITLSSL